MYSQYPQQQDINVSDQKMPGFCFSNPDNITPEFLPTTNQPNYHYQQQHITTTNSFDLYPPTFYANSNSMVIPFTDIHIKSAQQQLFHSDLSFMGTQNYLSPVSYDSMHMMTAPATIPASPLSSVFSSSSSPQMDDFLSMDTNNNFTPSMSDFETCVIPSQPFSPISKKITRQHTTSKKKDTSVISINRNNFNPIKKKNKQAMVPVLGEFICDFEGCGKIFGRKYNLSSHLVTHYAERKYFCDQCPKSFVRRHDLKRHMRIHTGETPHKCLYCDRGFGRADALQRHYLTDNTCAIFYNNDPLRNRYKKKTRSTGFGAKV